jgi:hypothetical protein|tara:strand:+ start:89 stop:319 length:231 start_codon:yes stop_codon:yes gene_type:complete
MNSAQQNMDLASSVDLSKATTVECEACSNKTFKQTLIIKRLSAIVSPTGQEVIVPIAVFACERCDHVNQDLVDAAA